MNLFSLFSRRRNGARTRIVCGTLLALGTFIAGAPRGLAAQAEPAGAQAPAGDRIRVFLDCRIHGCDRDFLITEMPYVIWTQDRLDSEVHVLVTSLRTGAGGAQYTLALLGQGRFAGRGDTVATAIPPNSSDDGRRRELARVLELALVPYILRTSAASNFQLGELEPTEAGDSPQTIHDPWNFWVYRASASGNGSAESRESELRLEGSLSASRITEASKIEFDVDYEYEANAFTLSDGEKRSFALREADVSGRYTHSLSEHWSAGLGSNVGMSEFRNHDVTASLDVQAGYNLFPWREATSRQLVGIITVGGRYSDYSEVTIYGLTWELRPTASAIVAGESRQPWGSVDASLRHTQYLHDLSVYNVSFDARTEIRLTRGLSLQVSAFGEKVHDQLGLPRGDASDEEVLTRQRALATAYRYGGRIGISFTFGSIYNTIVNPRLEKIFD